MKMKVPGRAFSMNKNPPSRNQRRFGVHLVAADQQAGRTLLRVRLLGVVDERRIAPMIIEARLAAIGRGGRPRQLAEAFFGLALAPIMMAMDPIEAPT